MPRAKGLDTLEVPVGEASHSDTLVSACMGTPELDCFVVPTWLRICIVNRFGFCGWNTFKINSTGSLQHVSNWLHA